MIRSRLRNLVVAVFLSSLGDSLIPVAFALESTKRDSSGTLLSGVLLALWAGRFLGSVAARRIPPSAHPARQMIAADAVRLLAQAGLLAVLLGGASWQGAAMIASSGIYGVATAFFVPGRFMLLPAICPKENLGRANAILSVMGDCFGIAGPAAASLLVLRLGFASVLWIDVFSFGVGALVMATLWGVRAAGGASAEAPEAAEDDPVKARLPRWVNAGLGSWLLVATAIGFMGVAGPTVVIANVGERAWAAVAVALAIGSLAGSVSMLRLQLSRPRWQVFHVIACGAYALQIFCFGFSGHLAALVIPGVVGSALVTATGISWDTLGQRVGGGTPAEVHTFATRDQLVNTIGIPAGTLLFSAAGFAHVQLWALGLVLAGVVLAALPVVLTRDVKA